jgi:integrase
MPRPLQQRLASTRRQSNDLRNLRSGQPTLIVQHERPAVAVWQVPERCADSSRLFQVWVHLLRICLHPAGGDRCRSLQVAPGEAHPPAQEINGQVGGDAKEPGAVCFLGARQPASPALEGLERPVKGLLRQVLDYVDKLPQSTGGVTDVITKRPLTQEHYFFLRRKLRMRVQRIPSDLDHQVSFHLLDDSDQPIAVVSGFMRHLAARGCSPNTLSAYAFDLLHFMQFLKREQLIYQDFTPPHALLFLEYLRALPCRKQARRLGLALVSTADDGSSATHLSPSSINRIFAAVSSFYEYLILSAQLADRENPIEQIEDPALARVPERHRPFMGRASRQRPMRRAVRVKTVQRVPRPMEDEQLDQLLASLTLKRDRAMLLLMLHGGLRPGEVLNLQVGDIQYGRKRVIIHYRTDHPKGVRTKSRTERLVDLRQPETLQAVNDYVMYERPQDADSPYVFLVGGQGKRRHEPLSYHALVKLFERRCNHLGIRDPWNTPHALRHTHATKMWEGGMRELTLQKRLGHASPESTRMYTRVSDPVVVAEYRRALGEDSSI